MRILSFDSLDSTSSHASRLLDAAEGELPFAVLSRSQTHGRGRSGRDWSSPDGGLYLTLVLARCPAVSEQGQLPLWTAAITAQWLQKRFGIRCTIKWPNDLLFGTRKLAGILCESRVQGKDWGPFLIGIGINLHDAPPVIEQLSTSLDAISGRFLKCDALALGEELIAALEQGLAQKDWWKIYESFALEAGQVFVRNAEDYARLVGVEPGGQLRLQKMGTDEFLSLNSADHGYRWQQQLPQPGPLLLADLGNSLGKLAVFSADGNQALDWIRVNLLHPKNEDSAALKDFLEKLDLPVGWPIFVISVSARATSELRAQLAPYGLIVFEVPKRPLLINFGAYKFSELGIDRVAMAEAATHFFPGEALIVVSAGTCVTVEVLDPERNYLGGYIMPGLQSKLHSMHLRTDRLPSLKMSDLDASMLDQRLGKDTRSAMLLGVLHETAGAIKNLIQELQRTGVSANWRVVCTGGDAEFLAPFLGAEHRPHIILQGVRLMVLGGQI